MLVVVAVVLKMNLKENELILITENQIVTHNTFQKDYNVLFDKYY